MKKFLTALIAFVMCFSVVTTVFAATPDEASDSDLISDIKQAMLDTYYGDEKPEYLNVEILLDDEDEVYFSFSDSFATSANRVYTEAGNYIVSYLENCPVALYKNNRVYMIPDAYNSGVIDDDTLEGLTYCGHMDIVPKSDDSALVIEIKNKVIEECFDGKSPETLRIDIVGRTSDGGVYFKHSVGGGIDVMVEETIGDYTYYYNHNDDVMLYKNGNVYSIKEAYESGVIDDSILEELSKMNFGLESNKPNTTVPTEPTTSVATVDEPVTVPDTTSATKPVSTSDTATNDTPNNSQNNSGAVQTGQNSVAVILLVAMLAGCAVIFAKRRNYFK